MGGESGQQVEDELEWHHQVSDLCRAYGMRQEVDSRDEVTFQENRFYVVVVDVGWSPVILERLITQ